MPKDNVDKQQNRIILLIGLFLVFICCLAYSIDVYFTQILPEKLAKQSYKETQCFIMSKKLSTKKEWWKTSRADFLVSYRAEKVQYNRWVSANGLDRDYTRNNASQVSLLANYRIGSKKPCYYNPESPSTVVLAFRNQSDLYGILAEAGTLGLLALLFFIVNTIRIYKKINKRKPRK